MVTRVFGIRHHGPGSARSLVAALEDMQPDIVLIEGPPEADGLIELARQEMEPPIALLVYNPEDLQQAVYYPFAVFSPEWQAIQYGLDEIIPIRFIDLPAGNKLELPERQESFDPLGLLAAAAGFADGERYWEHLVEHRRDSSDIFAGVGAAMTALREAAGNEGAIDPNDLIREAYMRQQMRQAIKEGFEKIAIVCGAWHAPVLMELGEAKADRDLLAGLTKTKMSVTWTPWSYGRLALSSGYGAGIESPGWYDLLWHQPQAIAVRWVTAAARLLRAADLDASSASVIEAVRLAEALAALRNLHLPGLPELNGAIQTVLCGGEELPMTMIREQLMVADRLGHVPESTPQIPLQRDLQATIQRLRLKQQPLSKSLELDLREANDLEKSTLLHRLRLLNINWGTPRATSGKGTFKEGWEICWQPELAVATIEAGIWGNSVVAAAVAYAKNTAALAQDLPVLTELLDRVLLSDLGVAIPFLMERLEAIATLTSDNLHLMNALPPLVNILRYSDVRQTDTTAVGAVVDGLVTRMCIGLPSTCQSLDDDGAQPIFAAIQQTHSTLKILQQPEYQDRWQKVLQDIADRDHIHGLVRGRCCRLLFDDRYLDISRTSQRLSLALSTANETAQAAAWVEGFLKGSGLLLLHSEGLWDVLDEWVSTLSPDAFLAVLPLLRRTFGEFSPSERQQMGDSLAERLRHRAVSGRSSPVESEDFDPERAMQALPPIAALLGLSRRG
jgi:Family of unknown function (DUF5682)